MPSYKPVTAVLRALEVLGAVSRHGVSTVSQIARDTGLNASTVVRCLETLESAGTDALTMQRLVKAVAASPALRARKEQP